jgi:hypothetical protein
MTLGISHWPVPTAITNAEIVTSHFLLTFTPTNPVLHE